MALLLENKNFLYTNTTLTGNSNSFPTATASAENTFALVFWVYVPTTVASAMCLFDYYNTGDTAEFRLELNTDKTINIFSSKTNGTNGSVDTTALNNGWNLVQVYKAAGTSQFRYRINGGGQTNATTDTFSYDVTLTELLIGRRKDGSNPADGVRLSYISTWKDIFDTTETAAIYNSGKAKNPATSANVEQDILSLRNSLTPELGSLMFLYGREPKFVNDDDIIDLAAEAAWTDNTYQLMPAVRNAELLYNNGNMDFFMNGDSFTVPSFSRTTYKFIDTLADLCDTKVKKFANFITETNDNTNPILAIPAMTDARIDFNDDYAWENGTTWSNADTPTQMATPIYWGNEILSSPVGLTDPIISFDFRNCAGASGGFSDWLSPTDSVEATLILRKPTQRPLSSFGLADNNGAYETKTLSGVDGIPLGVSRTLTENVSGKKVLKVGPPNGTWSGVTNGYLQMIGVMADNLNSAKGVGFCTIADSSWSIDNHSINLTSSGSGSAAKKYTDEQIEGVISAFVDPNRKIIFTLNIANETGDLVTKVGDWVTAIERRCTSLGITNYSMLIISQFCHTMNDTDDTEHARTNSRDLAIDMDTVAQSNPNVCHISLYKLTDGCFFYNQSTGFTIKEPNDANGPQQKWLEDFDTANGTTYATSPGKDGVLDSGSLHLSGAGADLMSYLLAKAIVENGSVEPVEPESSIDVTSSDGSDSLRSSITVFYGGRAYSRTDGVKSIEEVNYERLSSRLDHRKYYRRNRSD